MEVLVEAAMRTPDGVWRVEVVRRRGSATRWYRIVRGDDDAVLDWLSISAVERILAEAGIDMSTLVEAHDGERHDGEAHGDPARDGVA